MAAPTKKGGPDLAIVFGGKGGGSSRGGMSEPEPDGDEPMGEGDESMGGEFDVAADEFLDDTLPPEERKAALKRAVMACMGEDY